MINYLKDVYNIPEEYQYQGTIYPDDIFIDKFSFTDHNGKENIYLMRKGKESLKVVSPCDNILELFEDSFEFNNFVEKESENIDLFRKKLNNEFNSVQFYKFESEKKKKKDKGGWRNFYSRGKILRERLEKDWSGKYLNGLHKNNNYTNLTCLDEKEALFMILRIYAKGSVSIPNEKYSEHSLRGITHIEYKNYSLIIFRYVSDYSIKYIYMLLHEEESYDLVYEYTEKFDMIINVSDSIDELLEGVYINKDEKKDIRDFFTYFIEEVYQNGLEVKFNEMKLREFEKDGNTYKYSEYNLKELISGLYYVQKLKGAEENE